MKKLGFMIFSVILLGTLSTFAFETTHVHEATLKIYGRTLAEHASQTQWQQLWNRVKNIGLLSPSGDHDHFTQPSRVFPDLISSVLLHATSVRAKNSTQAVYRLDFAPNVIGVISGKNTTVACVTVDWKAVPEGAAANSPDSALMAQMILANPCN